MRVVVNLLVLMIVIIPLRAQNDTANTDPYGWTHTVVANLNITQNSYDNWVKGGENTLAWQLTLNGSANLEEERYLFTNKLLLDYGRTKVGGDDSRKSVDEINFESVFTYMAGIYVNPYASIHLLTQFTEGFDENDSDLKVSDFFDPGYLTQSIGIGYEPIKEVNTRLGFAVKETFTNEAATNLTDDADTDEIEKTKVEAGLESVTNLKVKLAETIGLSSTLNIFSNVERIDETDVDWNSTFTGKLTDLVNVNLNIRLVYDKDLSERRQIKQVLAIGFSYTVL